MLASAIGILKAPTTKEVLFGNRKKMLPIHDTLSNVRISFSNNALKQCKPSLFHEQLRVIPCTLPSSNHHPTSRFYACLPQTPPYAGYHQPVIPTKSNNSSSCKHSCPSLLIAGTSYREPSSLSRGGTELSTVTSSMSIRLQFSNSPLVLRKPPASPA